MSDIVEQLRDMPIGYVEFAKLMHEAADEIERLRHDRDSLESTVDSLRQEIERLREQLKQAQAEIDRYSAIATEIADDTENEIERLRIAITALTGDLGK